MTQRPAEIAGRAMAEHAGFSWENCAQQQWIEDADAAIAKLEEAGFVIVPKEPKR